jgi:hypothetical protein
MLAFALNESWQGGSHQIKSSWQGGSHQILPLQKLLFLSLLLQVVFDALPSLLAARAAAVVSRACVTST